MSTAGITKKAKDKTTAKVDNQLLRGMQNARSDATIPPPKQSSEHGLRSLALMCGGQGLAGTSDLYCPLSRRSWGLRSWTKFTTD